MDNVGACSKCLVCHEDNAGDCKDTSSYEEMHNVKEEVVLQTTTTFSAQKEESREVRRGKVEETSKAEVN